MVKVDAGTYWVGKNPENQYQSAVQSIDLEEFWIDQYQVTNKDYQQYITEWSIPPGEENYPVMGVSWDEAAAYCRSKNKRLPDEAEWEAAGRGSGEAPPLFPWGFNPYPRLPDERYDVGTQPANVSRLGVHDMLGNVYEWVDNPYGRLGEGKRLLRGARYSNPVPDLAFRVEVGPDDTIYVPYAGFRCAAEQVKED